jgi:RNA polymerase sigma-70 factor (ECF subfamily)
MAEPDLSAGGPNCRCTATAEVGRIRSKRAVQRNVTLSASKRFILSNFLRARYDGGSMDSRRIGDDVPERAGSAPAGETDRWDSTFQILVRARTGDRSAARRLIERALPSLRRWTHGRIPPYGRGGEDTDDIVQDAVLQMLRRIETFEHRTVGAVQAYLRETVINRIRDIVRRVKRRGAPLEPPEDLVGDAPSPLELAIMGERFERFVEALQRLRPRDRQAIVWRVELGYSYEEIGRRLGKSNAAAARMTVSRALARLADEMKIKPVGK